MQLPVDATLKECGVDWVTATARDSVSRKELLRQGERLINEASAAGDYVRPFNWKGFVGWCVNACDVGEREDCAMVRIHGKLAAVEWWDVVQVAQNVTRIDLQQTWASGLESPGRVLSRAYRAVQRTKLHGKPVEWHYRRDSKKGNTLEFGRRSSESFGRMYDKGLESKLDHYSGCVRMEGEFKGDTAWSITKHLGSGALVQDVVNSHVQSFFSKRGVHSPTLGVINLSLKEPPRTRDVDRYLRWLATSLRGSVQDAVERRGLDAVLVALGLDHLVQGRPT